MQDLQDQLGLTYLFITHDLSVVKHLSDHIMAQGKTGSGKLVLYSTVYDDEYNMLTPKVSW